MKPSLHHVHLMASDLPATIDFWERHLGEEVVADLVFSGSRNVFIKVGNARVHIYDKAPNERGTVNHLGVMVEDIVDIVKGLAAAGWSTRPIKVDAGTGVMYSMVEGPDRLLLEIFELECGAEANAAFRDNEQEARPDHP